MSSRTGFPLAPLTFHGFDFAVVADEKHAVGEVGEMMPEMEGRGPDCPNGVGWVAMVGSAALVLLNG